MTKTKEQIRDAEAEKVRQRIKSYKEDDPNYTFGIKQLFYEGWDCRDKLDNEALKIAIEKFNEIIQFSVTIKDADFVCREALAEIKKIVGEG